MAPNDQIDAKPDLALINALAKIVGETLSGRDINTCLAVSTRILFDVIMGAGAMPVTPEEFAGLQENLKVIGECCLSLAVLEPDLWLQTIVHMTRRSVEIARAHGIDMTEVDAAMRSHTAPKLS